MGVQEPNTSETFVLQVQYILLQTFLKLHEHWFPNMLKLIKKSFDMRRAKLQQHYPAFYWCRTFYGSWGFILMFTRFHHLSICRARGILTVLAEHISWRYILVLFFHPFIGLAGDLCPSDFSTNTVYTFFFPHMFHVPSPSHPPWFDHVSNNTTPGTFHHAFLSSVLLFPSS